MTQFPLDRIREAAKAYFERRLNEALELTLDLPVGAFDDDRQLEVDGFEQRILLLENSLKTESYPTPVSEASAALLRTVAPGLPDVRYIAPGLDAVRIARKLVAEAELLSARFVVAELSGGTYDAAPGHPVFRGILPTQLPDPDQGELAPPLQVEAAIVRYKDLKHNEWAPKTRADQARSLALACEVFGASKNLADVSKDDVQRLRDVLMRMPKNALKAKANAGKFLAQLASDDAASALSFKTRDKYFTMVRSFLKWAVDEEFIEKMPGPSIRMMGAPNVAAIEDRNPYSDEQLTAVFTSPLFVGSKSSSRRSAPGDTFIKDAYFWIPLVAIFAGMRLGEIVQLRVKDIKVSNGVPFFDVCKDEKANMRLKTALSARHVPVHPS